MTTDNVLDLIGNTPLIEIKPHKIFAKAEFLNPGGSIKDRVALAMIEGAERSGKINKNTIFVEPTSGNTGIGLALVGRLKGYKVVIVMPENMSEERKKLITSLGAELILTPAKASIEGSVKKTEEIVAGNPNAFTLQQFENPDNPLVHFEGTARELWRQMRGNIDVFVAGVGSGGTLQGIGEFLKKHKPNVKLIAVEPKNVSALMGHEPGLHQIQGIGDGFIPKILNPSMIDEVIEVTDDEAIETARELNCKYGLMTGISARANIFAARKIAAEFPGARIGTVLPDRVERYFSSSMM
ncbi:MAG: cysteine synthase A [Lentisphaerae bacterium]|nr:cysteine synthase A [Lentisphaerota bacterium]MCP4101827.1 cysteine synthase A [Lentisphaerota bacterium]